MKKKIAFVWYYDRASQVLPNWRDGLRGAIEIIEKKHDVEWFVDKTIPQDDIYDIICFWDDSHSPFFTVLDQYPKAKKGIFLTTLPQDLENLRKLDAVFCESQPVLKEVLKGGAKGFLAFGTDTDFYTPDYKVVKDIKYFYPATFSPWKKQSSIAYLGKDLLVVGTLQPDGIPELEACEEAGVQRRVGYFPPEEIRDYYNRATNVIIPAVHGSERTALEALSMNIVPIVTDANERTLSYVKEFIESGVKSPREFALKNYSHHGYADVIMKAFDL